MPPGSLRPRRVRSAVADLCSLAHVRPAAVRDHHVVVALGASKTSSTSSMRTSALSPGDNSSSPEFLLDDHGHANAAAGLIGAAVLAAQRYRNFEPLVIRFARSAPRRLKLHGANGSWLGVIFLQISKGEDLQPAGEMLGTIAIELDGPLPQAWTENLYLPAIGLRTSCDSMAGVPGAIFLLPTTALQHPIPAWRASTARVGRVLDDGHAGAVCTAAFRQRRGLPGLLTRGCSVRQPAARRFRNPCRESAARHTAELASVAPGLGARQRCRFLPNRSTKRLAVLTGSGRPVRSGNVARWSMPSRWKIVAVRSAAATRSGRDSRRSCRWSRRPVRRGCPRRPSRS